MSRARAFPAVPTRTLVVDGARPDPGALAEAASVLRGGGLVAFPTESFYGLGTAALAPDAVARVFEVKGRPESKPLLVLVGSLEDAVPLCGEIGEGARELMRRHWPGPLTLVLPAAAGVPTAVTAGTGTIGVRVPGHPVALGLVRAAGLAVTAPSANPSGEAPAETAAAVRGYFDGRIDLVLDGGPTSGGTGSTVADCTVWPPRILRQGPVRLS
jgi:L-threonylcarbamoyladenylate synthase